MSESGQGNEKSQIRAALKNLPMEVLLKQQREGAKEFNRLYFGKGDKESGDDQEGSERHGTMTAKGTDKDGPAKHHKGRPREVSAKVRPKPKTDIFEIKERKGVDPRFEGASSDFRMDRFLSSYGFLKDLKEKEVSEESKLAKKKGKIRKMDPKEREKLLENIRRNKQELNYLEKIRKQEEVKQGMREELKSKGVTDPFLRKSDLTRAADPEAEGEAGGGTEGLRQIRCMGPETRSRRTETQERHLRAANAGARNEKRKKEQRLTRNRSRVAPVKPFKIGPVLSFYPIFCLPVPRPWSDKWRVPVLWPSWSDRNSSEQCPARSRIDWPGFYSR